MRRESIARKSIQQAPRRLDPETYGHLAHFGHQTGRWDLVHDVADLIDRDRNQLSLDLPITRREIPLVPMPTRGPSQAKPRRQWFSASRRR